MQSDNATEKVLEWTVVGYNYWRLSRGVEVIIGVTWRVIFLWCNGLFCWTFRPRRVLEDGSVSFHYLCRNLRLKSKPGLYLFLLQCALWLVYKNHANFSTNQNQKQNHSRLDQLRFPALLRVWMFYHNLSMALSDILPLSTLADAITLVLLHSLKNTALYFRRSLVTRVGPLHSNSAFSQFSRSQIWLRYSTLFLQASNLVRSCPVVNFLSKMN